ncbi:MAG: MATE family efflux transporter, partial [Pseudomonadota bacterium]
MNFVDTVMAGRLGQIDLGAVAIGSTIWAAGMLFALGVLMTIPPTVSQLDGSGRRKQAGEATRQGLWIALALSLLMFIGMRSVGLIQHWLDLEPQVAALALDYLRAISWGAPAFFMMLVLRFFSEGAGITKPTMYIGVLGILLNIPLNYALMFGNFGLPALGAVGCGWATAIVYWIQVLALAGYIRYRDAYQDYGLFSRFSRPNWLEIGGLLKVGIPIGVMIFFEGSLFVGAALLIGTLGALPIAAHQVAINFASMAFMVPLGLSGAISVRVGNAIGRGEPDAARLAGLVGIGIAVVFGCVSALVMWVLPTPIARIYTNDAEVIALAAQLLLLAAAFQIADGIQVAAAGALRGMKDTRQPMIYSILSYWMVGMSVGWWLTFRQEWGPQGMWYGMIAGLSVAAVLMSTRFWRRTGQLLEPIQSV